MQKDGLQGCFDQARAGSEQSDVAAVLAEVRRLYLATEVAAINLRHPPSGVIRPRPTCLSPRPLLV